MKNTIHFDGVYCRKVDDTLTSYFRFFKDGTMMERATTPVPDSNFNIWGFKTILDKGVEKMGGGGFDFGLDAGFDLGLGSAKNDGPIMIGTYTVEKDGTLKIKDSDGFIFNGEYVAISSKDGMELVIKPFILMGQPITDNRQFKHTFRKFLRKL